MKDWIVLSPAEREELNGLVGNGFVPSIMRQRAHILLLAAGGYSGPEIAEKLHVGTASVQRWVARFRNRPQGISMTDLTRTGEGRGRKRTIDEDAREWIRDFAKHKKSEAMSMAEFTELVRAEAENAGHPELANISLSSIGNILKG